jgi:hypothetical protein
MIGAAVFSGVHQSTPVVTADNQSNTGVQTVTVTSSTDGATIALAVSDGSFAAEQLKTPIFSTLDLGVCTTGSSYGIGGTSNGHQFNISAATAQMLGIHLQAAVAGTTMPADTLAYTITGTDAGLQQSSPLTWLRVGR